MSNASNATRASQELIEAHRAWIKSVEQQLGLMPTQIAKQAGLSATTLTRLVNDPDHPHALTATTIDKIVRKFGVAPPVSPDFAAFRVAVAHAIAALHRQSALQAGTPEAVAATVIEMADWLIKAGGKGAEQFDAVASFEAERLKRFRST